MKQTFLLIVNRRKRINALKGRAKSDAEIYYSQWLKTLNVPAWFIKKAELVAQWK